MIIVTTVINGTNSLVNNKTLPKEGTNNVIINGEVCSRWFSIFKE